jgi:hypothetical protein
MPRGGLIHQIYLALTCGDCRAIHDPGFIRLSFLSGPGYLALGGLPFVATSFLILLTLDYL